MQREFGASRLAIGGESAGAHLSAATLLRLRDAGRAEAFCAANLSSGCSDLSLTPSKRQARGTPLVDRAILEQLADRYAAASDLRYPDVSRLNANLAGLPPALLTVGTNDPLLDDPLLLHARRLAAGNSAELAVYSGGVHGFNNLGGDLSNAANERIARFLQAAVTSGGSR